MEFSQPTTEQQKTTEKNLSERIGEYFSLAIEEPKCPVCQSKRIHESRFRLRDLPLSLLRAKPYRCMSCYRRFYRWPWSKPLTGSSPNPPDKSVSNAENKAE